MLSEVQRAEAVKILLEAERTKKKAVQLSTTFPRLPWRIPTQSRQLWPSTRKNRARN